MTAVRVDRLRVGYDTTPVLDDLSLDVRSGEILAVLGASGSGKTTLLRALAGFLRPQAGSISFGDTVVVDPVSWVPPEKRRVGIVPQEGALFPHLDVAGNVGFGLPRRSEERIAAMLDLVGLPGAQQARPQELSGGQQQRVALARALAPEPDVLCLDEPFSALDATLRSRLRSDVRDVLGTIGTTTILVTHDQEEALSLADRVAVVREGRIVQVDAPERLYEQPADLPTAQFVGEAVELPATVVEDGLVDCALGPVRVPGARRDQRGTLVLRPEQLAIVDDRPVADAPAAGAAGVVRDCSYHGHDSVLRVLLADGLEVGVRVPGSRAPRPGDRVRVVVGGTGLLFTHS